jgi:hypothetical protein
MDTSRTCDHTELDCDSKTIADTECQIEISGAGCLCDKDRCKCGARIDRRSFAYGHSTASGGWCRNTSF